MVLESILSGPIFVRGSLVYFSLKNLKWLKNWRGEVRKPKGMTHSEIKKRWVIFKFSPWEKKKTPRSIKKLSERKNKYFGSRLTGRTDGRTVGSLSLPTIRIFRECRTKIRSTPDQTTYWTTSKSGQDCGLKTRTGHVSRERIDRRFICHNFNRWLHSC